MKIYELSQKPDLLEDAIMFYWQQWGTKSNFDFYKDSIVHSMDSGTDLSKFYILLENETIVGSYALLRNDLISRQDLCPWLGCLYIIPEARGRGLGGTLLEDACNEAKRKGYDKIYLCTSLEGYYEKYDWSYYGVGYYFNGEPTQIYYKIT